MKEYYIIENMKSKSKLIINGRGRFCCYTTTCRPRVTDVCPVRLKYMYSYILCII